MTLFEITWESRVSPKQSYILEGLSAGFLDESFVGLNWAGPIHYWFRPLSRSSLNPALHGPLISIENVKNCNNEMLLDCWAALPLYFPISGMRNDVMQGLALCSFIVSISPIPMVEGRAQWQWSAVSKHKWQFNNNEKWIAVWVRKMAQSKLCIDCCRWHCCQYCQSACPLLLLSNIIIAFNEPVYLSLFLHYYERAPSNEHRIQRHAPHLCGGWWVNYIESNRFAGERRCRRNRYHRRRRRV